MPSKISSSCLTALLVAGTLLCGIKPAALPYVLMPLGLLLVFIWRDANGKFAVADPVTALLIGLVLAWAAVSLQWAILPARGMYDLIVLSVLAIIVLQMPGGVAALDSPVADRALKLFIALAMAALLIYVMDVNLDMIWQRSMMRVDWYDNVHAALLTRPGFCAALLLWPIVAYGWQRGWNLMVFFIWIIIGLTLLATDSANGRLAYVVSTLVFLLASCSPKLVRMMFAVALIFGLVMAVPAARMAQDTLEGSGRRINNSFMHRTEIWKFAAARIMEKPILGWGFDSSRAIPNGGEISKYQNHDPLKSMIPMHPHNWFLQALLELGIVGAILLTALWLWLLRQTARLHRTVQPVALATYGTAMTIGTFSIGIWQSWWLAALVFIAIIIQLMDHEAHRTRQ